MRPQSMQDGLGDSKVRDAAPPRHKAMLSFAAFGRGATQLCLGFGEEWALWRG